MGQDHFTQNTTLACPHSQIPTKVTIVTQNTALACPQSQIQTRVKQLARFYTITAVLLRTGVLLECNGCRWESDSRLSEKPCCFTSTARRHNVTPQKTSISKIIYAANTVSLNLAGVHESLHRDTIMKVNNKMQLYGLIYYS